MVMFLNIFVIPNKYFKLQEFNSTRNSIILYRKVSSSKLFFITKKCIQIFFKTKKYRFLKLLESNFC
jgi:hypothetical protein